MDKLKKTEVMDLGRVLSVSYRSEQEEYDFLSSYLLRLIRGVTAGQVAWEDLINLVPEEIKPIVSSLAGFKCDSSTGSDRLNDLYSVARYLIENRTIIRP